jgi:hypothetical protein
MRASRRSTARHVSWTSNECAGAASSGACSARAKQGVCAGPVGAPAVRPQRARAEHWARRSLTPQGDTLDVGRRGCSSHGEGTLWLQVSGTPARRPGERVWPGCEHARSHARSDTRRVPARIRGQGGSCREPRGLLCDREMVEALMRAGTEAPPSMSMMHAVRSAVSSIATSAPAPPNVAATVGASAGGLSRAAGVRGRARRRSAARCPCRTRSRSGRRARRGRGCRPWCRRPTRGRSARSRPAR